MTQRDNTTKEDRDLRALFDDLRREEHLDVPPFRPNARPRKIAPAFRRFAIATSAAAVLLVGAVSVGLILRTPREDVLMTDVVEPVDTAEAPVTIASNLSTAPPPEDSPKPVAEPAEISAPPDPAPPLPPAQGPKARPTAENTARAVPVPAREDVIEALATEEMESAGWGKPPKIAEPRPQRIDHQTEVTVRADAERLEVVALAANIDLRGPKKKKERDQEEIAEIVVTNAPQFSDEFIRDLPAQGRYYTNVLTLEPGVSDGEPIAPRLPGPPPVAPRPTSVVDPLIAGSAAVIEPRLISVVEPGYPELARKARIETDVVLNVLVLKDGTVGEVEVLQAGREGLGFEQEAVAAVQRWRYEPATSQGNPVDVYYTVKVNFDLDGQSQIVTPEETSPGLNTESYAAIDDNPFHVVADEPLSTFSADVDTASYANVRRFLDHGRLPPRDAVRVEELINYFDYDHAPARGDDPFGVEVEIAGCPWNPRNRLARIILAARREVPQHNGSNLVFLLDVSGSMNSPNKLPLVKRSMAMLVDQLSGRDTVSIVVYAGASGLALPPTPGSDRATILEALDRLQAGGSTAGAAGLRLAYKIARENFIESGINRVILATDGDFNVGVTSESRLLGILEGDAKRGIFLTTLGYGMGNYKDDRLEYLADKGNGNYAYIDTLAEARKVLVDEIDGTLVTVAKDVKFQIEFNPVEVGAYRLIGYENRLLAHRDFNDDTKDAGEVGAGHTVTVLYELRPPDEPGTEREVDPMRYTDERRPSDAAASGELFTLKIRFKKPDEDVSSLREYPARDGGLALRAASDDLRFAAAVASFGMRLRQSAPVRDFGWGEIKDLAAGAVGRDDHGHRAAFTDLLDRASRIAP